MHEDRNYPDAPTHAITGLTRPHVHYESVALDALLSSGSPEKVSPPQRVCYSLFNSIFRLNNLLMKKNSTINHYTETQVVGS